MSVSYDIDKESAFFVAKARGRVGHSELETLLSAMARDSRINGEMRHLYDLRSADEIAVDPRKVRDAVARCIGFRGRIAFVSETVSIIQWSKVLAEDLHAEGIAVGCFPVIENAELWLVGHRPD